TPPTGGPRYAVLAEGVDFSAVSGDEFAAVNWCHPVWSQPTYAQIDAVMLDPNVNTCHLLVWPGMLSGPHGTIVFYEHAGGGSVLNLATIDAPRGLQTSLAPAANRFSALAERALQYMLGLATFNTSWTPNNGCASCP
ncbi:MAG TPA: hypothetical protein VKE69_01490, partial [Planctomycetota bacterium]|nr:hypothetical protein [Planctomycetota bacterium]